MEQNQLDALIKMAKEARDTAAKLLAGEQRNYRHICAQIEQLLNYRQDYRNHLQELVANGIDLATYREYQRFLGTLDTAISNAQSELEKYKQQLAKQREMWQQKQRTLSSYDTLAERKREAANKAEMKKEQKLHDEMNSNAFSRKIINQSNGNA